jgi:hypothetical protein
MSQTAVRVEEPAARRATSPRLEGRAAVPELLWGLGAGALALLGAVLVLELWDISLRVPFAYLVDAVFYLMVIKAVLDHGWVGENPNLGAPFGQQLWDFPSVNGDALQLAIVKGFGLFTHDPALVMNLFFLLTFPLTGVVAFLVLARLRGALCASALPLRARRAHLLCLLLHGAARLLSGLVGAGW